MKDALFAILGWLGFCLMLYAIARAVQYYAWNHGKVYQRRKMDR